MVVTGAEVFIIEVIEIRVLISMPSTPFLDPGYTPLGEARFQSYLCNLP